MTCHRLFSLTAGLILSASAMAFAADVKSLTNGEVAKKAIAEVCLKDLQAFEKQLWRVGFGKFSEGQPSLVGPTEFYDLAGEGPARTRIRILQQAARVYAYAGDEGLCQQTLASMQAIYGHHQKLLGTEADNPDVRIAWRKAHLSRATPVAEMDHLMRASILIGSEIRNLKDERLGEITDIVLNPDKRDILYVLASHGGFLGFGDKLVAVRWTDLRATEDHQLYVLDVAAKAFDDAPAVGRHNFATTAESGWQRALVQYWDQALKK